MSIAMPRAIWPALAAVLALLLAAEWLLPGAAPPPRVMPAIPAPGAGAAADAAVGQWASTILARPIFSPDRRPPAVADANAVIVLPRLTAIIITPETRRAVFLAPDGKALALGPGGEVAGYELKSITAGSVVLLGPDGGITTVRPQFLTPPPADAASQ
jgi:general secretion pathway protein N